MTRAELIQEVADRTGFELKDCDFLVRTALDIITEQVARGERISISGFGTFERRRRKATFARNPATGELLRIAEQNVAVFRAGTSLKEAIKSSNS